MVRSRFGSIARTAREYPGYTFMRSIARFDAVRESVAALQRSIRPPLGPYLSNLERRPSAFFPESDAADILSRLQRDGFALGLSLPASTVATLRDFAENHPCFADRDPSLGFMPFEIERARQKLGRKFLLAQYYNLLSSCPVVEQISRDPLLLRVAGNYLQTPPTLVSVALFWSYPATLSDAEHSHAAQMFHYDLDDFRFLKFFFYLSDVDDDSGPHVAVRGSHRGKRHSRFRDRFKVRRYSDAEIQQLYGRDAVERITGPAGTGFAEDTLCIHKGASPISRERLMMQVQYAYNDWGIQSDEKSDTQLRMI